MANRESAQAEQIEREYPHVAQVPVLRDDLHSVIVDMLAWHRVQSIPPRRGQHLVIDDFEYVRWCFDSADKARALRAEFGGLVMVARPPR